MAGLVEPLIEAAEYGGGEIRPGALPHCLPVQVLFQELETVFPPLRLMRFPIDNEISEMVPTPQARRFMHGSTHLRVLASLPLGSAQRIYSKIHPVKLWY